MKILLDENISWRLCEKLKEYFLESKHVKQIGLSQPAKDKRIWDHALKHDFIIVTNDENFLNLSSINGFPPKVILLRTGNQSTTFLESLLISHENDIRTLNHSADYGVLELF